MLEDNEEGIKTSVVADNEDTVEEMAGPEKGLVVEKALPNDGLSAKKSIGEGEPSASKGDQIDYVEGSYFDGYGFGWKLLSDSFFMVGSALYLVMAVEAQDWYEYEDGLPEYVKEADDDATWEEYYNETGAEIWEDDYLFMGNKNEGSWVTREMCIYFAAALCFLLTGLLDLWRTRHWFPVLMILAAAFGVASSMLLVKDERLSNIFNAVSVHLFAVEASFLLFTRRPKILRYCLYVGDFFFFCGTIMDCVLSYFHVREEFNVRMGKAEIAAACCWLACSLIYVGATIYLYHQTKGIPPRIELAARITLVNFCGFCFAVAAPSTVTPSSIAYLIGVMATALSIVIPSLLFGIGLGFPAVIIVLTLALIFSSMLLAAATVSDGLLVLIFALYALWICSFRYGPDREKTGGIAGILVMVAAMMALSFRQVVQDGLILSLDLPYNETLNETQGFLPVLALEALCISQNQSPDCWEEDFEFNLEDTISFEVSEGVFAGQNATIALDEVSSTLFVSFEGGLYWVAGLWTWKGLDNPLANNRNFLIAVCWGLFCVLCGMIVPPWRTVRKSLSCALVPAALNAAKSALDDSLCSSEDTNSKGHTGDDAKEQEPVEGRDARIGRLVHYMNTIMNGRIAMLTAFECRICKAPFECTWPKLKELMQRTNDIVYVSITIAKWHPNMLEDRQGNKAIEDAVNVVGECAKALKANEEPLYTLEPLKEHAIEESADKGSLFAQKDRFMTVLSQKVLDSSIAWLNAMIHPDSKQWSKNIAKTYGLSLGVPILIFKKLVMVIAVPFRPRSWDAFAFLEFLKFTSGFVGLFVMSVFWEGYDKFSLDVGSDGVAGLYSGWNLVAFVFATTLTLEGSLNKAIARVIGTCLGGFMAWLGIIVCSGSYDDDYEINAYGIVVWLTVTSAIAAYFTVEPGFVARLGIEKDYGWVGFYFMLTQALCALEINAGKGERDDIVVNRIVQFLSGIAMAAFLAMLPPYTRGGDPRHARQLLMEMVDALTNGLDILLSQQDSTDAASVSLEGLRDRFRRTAREKRCKAQLLYKDAAHLKFIPFLRPDPELNTEIEEMSVTGSLIFSFLSFASYLSSSEHVVGLLEADSFYYQELVAAMVELLQEEYAQWPRNPEKERGKKVAELKTDEEYVIALLQLLWTILRRMETHDANLMKLNDDEFLEKFMEM